jgi:hypothetical protein
VTLHADSGGLFRCIVSNVGGSDTSVAARLHVLHLDRARITQQPDSVTVYEGSLAQFRVAAAGTKPISYQWQKNNIIIAGAVDTFYTVLVAVPADSGASFRCIVSNAGGSDTSLTARLHVLHTSPAGITKQPDSITVYEGTTARFTIIGSGTKPLTYQWQRNGVTISGATDSLYTTPATVHADSGALFRCIVSNPGGSDTSAMALLHVLRLDRAHITKGPDSLTVYEGSSAQFKVVAANTTSLSYQWQKNNISIEGAVDSAYSISVAVRADSGAQFRCIVSNPGGSDTSATALLRVLRVDRAHVTKGPDSLTVYEGAPAEFSIAATGTRPLNFQWQRNNVSISGATDSLYTIPVTLPANSGALFRCIVSNLGGSDTSVTARLRVLRIDRAHITKGPDSAVVYEGLAARFSVTASGTKPISYQWQKNSATIVGAVDSSCTVPATVLADSGALFRCIVSNVGGSDTSLTAGLHVLPIMPARITERPDSITVYEGMSARFTVVASGTKPINFQWQMNSQTILGATDSAYAIAATVRADSGSTFRCIVSNASGRDTSAIALLQVLQIDRVHITKGPDSLAVNDGTPALFSVAATGTRPLNFQWQRNNVSIFGATDSIYTLSTTVHADSGALFRCIVSNLGGSDTSRSGLLCVSLAQPSAPISVALKVYLQGPFSGTEMQTDLLDAGVIPMVQPYSAAPWHFSGTDTVSVVPGGVVDWVLIELRTDADSATKIATRAAFIKSDGTIVGLDGTGSVVFSSVVPGDYYVVVRHRNHLGVMSANPVALTHTSPLYDFTTGTDKYYGASAKALSAGKYGMYAGDANGDGQVRNDDMNDYLRPAMGQSGYKTIDINMNGQVQNDDLNDYLRLNIGKGTKVP